MALVLKAFLTGFILGAIFVLLKLPAPVPPKLAGLMGIVGIFVGYVVVSKFTN